MINPNNIDHINVKIFAAKADVDLGDAIRVFHRWIQDSVLDELLIDVADYRHVPEGPGVMLIGHDANYSLDNAFNRLGLLYNRKLPAEGTFQDKLLRAAGSALIACSHLEEERPFKDKLKFNAGQYETIVNDRLSAPNSEETWNTLKPELERFFDCLLGGRTYKIQHAGEPRERFRVSVDADAAVDVSSLVEALEPA